MEHSSSYVKWFLICMLHGTFVFCQELPAKTLTSENESDRMALLAFKSRIIQDPLQIMSSWNDSLHFCNWAGVICSPSNGRVLILNLEAQKLVGSIPPSIGNLSLLTGINLQNNSFHGEIPPELGRLLHLQHLNLTSNSLGGMIPTNLTHCTELRILNLNYNELTGPIPDQLSSLSKLLILSLGVNSLAGKIPAWIGNFSSLLILALTRNNLVGSIPDELGHLSHLGIFQLYGNQLSGIVPPSIYNISSIYYFSVTQNHLHGQIPTDVGLTLPNLQIFAGGVNNFKGTIPVSISNASGLEILDFAQNNLTGTLPTSLGRLRALYWLNFDDNELGYGKNGELNFVNSLVNCTNLFKLGIARNHFGGELPGSIANLSTKMAKFTMGSNLIHGNIPFGIGNLVNLINLAMEDNLFTGSVPDIIGKLQNLEGLSLKGNKLSGPIPPLFGNLTSLTKLLMEENSLDGNIPPSIGNCYNLLTLNLSRNNLSGPIPKQVIGLSSLSISLDISHNSLTGPIPAEVGNLMNLMELDVSMNNLTGEIPSSIASCSSLEILHMEHNMLQGTISQSWKTLRGLLEIDLSHNNLSGQIPRFLGKFSLKKLDLSFNDFEGEVPKEGIFANTSAISILGNDRLCGGVPELLLPACSKKLHSSGNLLAPKVVIPAITAIILISIMFCCLVAYLMLKKSRNRTSTATSLEGLRSGVSYLELLKSTNGFSMENLIGSGSFGSVYKGLDGDGKVIAVKVLNLQQEGASKSFIDECKALKRIRHRNLLKIITACSSVDLDGNDFKALIFDFMSNGNLDQWLHPRDDIEQHQAKSLNIVQRLSIAIDIAQALNYLHCHCETPIVHCDLKPSNVLLDEDMTAHVGDFGLAKILLEASSSTIPSSMSVALKGSIGYIPPEYGTSGQVSILGDVYSYGILLLEMFTGKRPTDDTFQDGLSIHKFVAMALPKHIMDIADPSLFVEEDEENDDENGNVTEEKAIIKEEDTQTSARSIKEECLVGVMRVGLSCSNAESRERMTMEDVVNKMHAIRDLFIGFENRNRRRMK
ncbi:hypothetical protein ACSBR2_034661 [Camellia fascicularis]